jgi:hypothetical protein
MSSNLTQADLAALAIATLANVKAVRTAVSALYAKSTDKTLPEIEQYLDGIAASEAQKILEKLAAGSPVV